MAESSVLTVTHTYHYSVMVTGTNTVLVFSTGPKSTGKGRNAAVTTINGQSEQSH